MNLDNVLKALVRDGNRFRSTPVVDDDFIAMKNQFDLTLAVATQHVATKRPTIVCLCGSTRFSEAFRTANLLETVEGNIVLSIGCDTKDDDSLFGKLSERGKAEMKRNLDELHLCKIDLADEVLILNVGGYIGESTQRELEYAMASGKRVRYLEEPE